MRVMGQYQPCWPSIEKGKDDSILRCNLRHDHVQNTCSTISRDNDKVIGDAPYFSLTCVL